MPASPALMASAFRGCGHSLIEWLYDPQLKHRCEPRPRPSEAFRLMVPYRGQWRQVLACSNALHAYADSSPRRVIDS